MRFPSLSSLVSSDVHQWQTQIFILIGPQGSAHFLSCGINSVPWPGPRVQRNGNSWHGNSINTAVLWGLVCPSQWSWDSRLTQCDGCKCVLVLRSLPDCPVRKISHICLHNSFCVLSWVILLLALLVKHVSHFHQLKIFQCNCLLNAVLVYFRHLKISSTALDTQAVITE